MTNIYKFILIISVTILVGACQNESAQDPVALIEEHESTGAVVDQSQFQSSKFELGKIEQKKFSKILNTTGSIHIPEKSRAAVNSLLSGTVGKINLIEGQWINKGQKLFSITNPELINLQEEYIVANGRLEYLREEYERQMALSKENLSIRKDLLKAKSELNTTEARHGALSKKLDLYGINTDNINTNSLVSSLWVESPISGYVTDIEVMQGMYIEPNQSALILANTSQVYLELSVLERDALQLKKGQKISFTLQSNPERRYTASVYLINKSINDRNVITVNCTIEGDTEQMVPGMYANADIILDEYTAAALPMSAIVELDEVYYALALKNRNTELMKFDRVSLKTGKIENGYVELMDDTLNSKEFLTKGAYFLIQ